MQPMTWQQWAFGIIVVLVGPCRLLYTVRLAGGHTLHGVMDFLLLLSFSVKSTTHSLAPADDDMWRLLII